MDCMCSWKPSTIFSKTVKRTNIPISRVGAWGEVQQVLRRGRSSGHWPSGISIDAIAEMTRAEEWRTSLLSGWCIRTTISERDQTKKSYFCSDRASWGSFDFMELRWSWGTWVHKSPDLNAIRFRNSTAASWRTYGEWLNRRERTSEEWKAYRNLRWYCDDLCESGNASRIFVVILVQLSSSLWKTKR